MITLLTPTRNRSKAFSLLETYIAKQTYKGDVQWIVCNDGDEPYRYTMGQQVIIRSTANDADEPGIHSLQFNYRAMLPLVKGSKIFCIEDDDYYHPDYLQVMSDTLDSVDLAGWMPDFYYHISARKWRNMKNYSWSSLASTAFTSDVLPYFEMATKLKDQVYLDLWIWAHWSQTLQRSAKLLLQCDSRPMHVGIKGLPYGERGIGLGHDANSGLSDKNLLVLKKWLPNDWKNYVP